MKDSNGNELVVGDIIRYAYMPDINAVVVGVEPPKLKLRRERIPLIERCRDINVYEYEYPRLVLKLGPEELI